MVKLLLPANLFKFPDFSLIFLVLKFTDYFSLSHFPWLFPNFRDFQDSSQPVLAKREMIRNV